MQILRIFKDQRGSLPQIEMDRPYVDTVHSSNDPQSKPFFVYSIGSRAWPTISISIDSDSSSSADSDESQDDLQSILDFYFSRPTTPMPKSRQPSGPGFVKPIREKLKKLKFGSKIRSREPEDWEGPSTAEIEVLVEVSVEVNADADDWEPNQRMGVLSPSFALYPSKPITCTNPLACTILGLKNLESGAPQPPKTTTTRKHSADENENKQKRLRRDVGLETDDRAHIQIDMKGKGKQKEVDTRPTQHDQYESFLSQYLAISCSHGLVGTPSADQFRMKCRSLPFGWRVAPDGPDGLLLEQGARVPASESVESTEKEDQIQGQSMDIDEDELRV
ncbi:hypothetical protein L218DRAFT_942796 [Marasmius fiardii PR-910]|nr:hypothetical protein L218DRAFT_942796 [Marasmius fiardii PR-910]